jgi:hypothetical protein
MKCASGVHEVSAVPAGEFRERYLEGTNVLKEHVYEKDGWIYWLGFFPAHVCSLFSQSLANIEKGNRCAQGQATLGRVTNIVEREDKWRN